jgi:hypothetical protein
MITFIFASFRPVFPSRGSTKKAPVNSKDHFSQRGTERSSNTSTRKPTGAGMTSTLPGGMEGPGAHSTPKGENHFSLFKHLLPKQPQTGSKMRLSHDRQNTRYGSFQTVSNRPDADKRWPENEGLRATLLVHSNRSDSAWNG